MKYLEIGKIVNTFGIKGELKIVSDSDFIDYRFKVGKKVYFKVGPKYLEMTVSSYRLIKGNVCITINKQYDINQVLQYVGCSVYCDEDDTPPLNEGEYLIDDLVGMDVYLEDNTLYGKVSDVLIIPSNNCIEILKVNNETEIIPFVEEYILDISDKIIIKPLGEMI